MRSAIKHTSLFIVGNLLCVDDARMHVHLGEQAISVRRFNHLAHIATALTERPASGLYSRLFSALALNREPDSQAQGAMALREISENPSPYLRARASLALGSNEYQAGNPDGAITLYQHAQSEDSLTQFLSLLMTAQALGLGGEHHKAVRLLEAVERMAFYVSKALPPYFFAWLNALAVELGQAGKTERALKLSAMATGSRYSAVYSEWGETYSELLSTQPRGLWAGYTHEPELIVPTEKQRKIAAKVRIARVVDNPKRTAGELESCAVAVEAVIL